MWLWESLGIVIRFAYNQSSFIWGTHNKYLQFDVEHSRKAHINISKLFLVNLVKICAILIPDTSWHDITWHRSMVYICPKYDANTIWTRFRTVFLHVSPLYLQFICPITIMRSSDIMSKITSKTTVKEIAHLNFFVTNLLTGLISILCSLPTLAFGLPTFVEDTYNIILECNSNRPTVAVTIVTSPVT